VDSDFVMPFEKRWLSRWKRYRFENNHPAAAKPKQTREQFGDAS